jgi:Na+-driven multidrug efflux pump
MRVLKYAVIAATAIMTTGFLIAMFLPYPCARLFTSDKTLIGLSIRGIRIVMMMFPIVGYQMVITNFFQSIGKAKISIFLSLSRQLLFLLPMLIILPPIFGVDGVWASMPISDAISSVVTGGVMIAYMKKFNRQHKELTNGK